MIPGFIKALLLVFILLYGVKGLLFFGDVYMPHRCYVSKLVFQEVVIEWGQKMGKVYIHIILFTEKYLSLFCNSHIHVFFRVGIRFNICYVIYKWTD